MFMSFNEAKEIEGSKCEYKDIYNDEVKDFHQRAEMSIVISSISYYLAGSHDCDNENEGNNVIPDTVSLDIDTVNSKAGYENNIL